MLFWKLQTYIVQNVLLEVQMLEQGS